LIKSFVGYGGVEVSAVLELLGSGNVSEHGAIT
jgi:hypothetical protein